MSRWRAAALLLLLGAGAAVPVAAEPVATIARAGADRCEPSAGIALGPAQAEAHLALGFGAASGLVAWTGANGETVARPLAQDGTPLTPARVLSSLPPGSTPAGVACLEAGCVLVTSGPPARAIALTPDATPRAAPVVLEIEDRMIAALGPGSGTGFALLARAWALSHVARGDRWLEVTQGDAGGLQQAWVAVTDRYDEAWFVPGPGPPAALLRGYRGLALAGRGRVLPVREPAAVAGVRLGVMAGPTRVLRWSDDALLVASLVKSADGRALQYWTIGSDAAAEAVGTRSSVSAPLRAPIENDVHLLRSLVGGHLYVSRWSVFGGLLGRRTRLDILDREMRLTTVTSGPTAWTGDRFAIGYLATTPDGPEARLLTLRCDESPLPEAPGL